MSDRIGITIGRRIRALREARGLTQSAFADIARKSVETISNFERGKTVPSVETIAKLAKLLHVDISEFFEAHETKSKGSLINPQAEFLSADDLDVVNEMIKLLYKRRRPGRK